MYIVKSEQPSYVSVMAQSRGLQEHWRPRKGSAHIKCHKGSSTYTVMSLGLILDKKVFIFISNLLEVLLSQALK